MRNCRRIENKHNRQKTLRLQSNAPGSLQGRGSVAEVGTSSGTSKTFSPLMIRTVVATQCNTHTHTLRAPAGTEAHAVFPEWKCHLHHPKGHIKVTLRVSMRLKSKLQLFPASADRLPPGSGTTSRSFGRSVTVSAVIGELNKKRSGPPFHQSVELRDEKGRLSHAITSFRSQPFSFLATPRGSGLGGETWRTASFNRNTNE